ncbi:hypothetical protein MNBD_ALPHA07-482 [hydrothermal vent metagenome]|uniref:Uncharacterized protein n=1 Tax=hydrothermal vent metagenome TaxID=652676 RepID=A0A3B0RVM2_9ZZZZ
MSQINTIKAVILSVLIVIGSALSSEAGDSGSGAFASVMSGVASLALKTVMEVHTFLTSGPGAALFSIGG